jgi:hypothetical protein
MEFVLTEEQQLLQDTAREFVSKNSSLRRIRALRDSGDALGFSRDLWNEMAKLGWLGIIFPEEYGGAGLGYTELMVVLEELGRGLMPEPVISNLLLAGSAIASGGSQAQREAVLPPVGLLRILDAKSGEALWVDAGDTIVRSRYAQWWKDQAARQERMFRRSGVDSIDIAAATASGIVVTRVPDYCIDEVSDHAMALLLSLVVTPTVYAMLRRQRATTTGHA